MNPNEQIESIVQEIAINAPAARIFDALSDPHERVKWWGSPGKFQATHMESDLRHGGEWQMSGFGIDNKPFTIVGKYLEVARPHILVFTWLPDWQDSRTPTIVRFELEEVAGVTTVRLTHSGFTVESDRSSYRGWPWLLALLQSYVTDMSLSASSQH